MRFLSLARYAVLAALILVAFPLEALAQAGAPTSTSVDFAPTITYLVALALALGGGVILYLGGRVLVVIRKKTGIEIDTKYLNILSEYATNKAGEILGKVLNAKEFVVDVKNPMIATAGNDALARIPDTLKHFGVDKSNAAEWVAKFIAGKLGVMTKDAPDVPTLPAAEGVVAGTVPASAAAAQPMAGGV